MNFRLLSIFVLGFTAVTAIAVAKPVANPQDSTHTASPDDVDVTQIGDGY